MFTYTAVDQIARIAANLGLGIFLAKVDIKSAYHLVLVHLRRHTPPSHTMDRILYSLDQTPWLPFILSINFVWLLFEIGVYFTLSQSLC